MRYTIKFLLISLVPVMFTCCTDQYEISVNSIYTIEIANEKFGIVKVVSVENEIVKIKPYKNIYNSRPSSNNVTKLNFATLNNRDGSAIPYGTLDKKAFYNLKPKKII